MEKNNTPHEAAARGGAQVRSENSLSSELPSPARVAPSSQVSQVLSLLARDHALVLLCDEDERVVWVQDQLSLLPGEAETIIGRPVREVLPAYDSAEHASDSVEVESTQGERLRLDIRSFAVHAATQSRAVVARRISDLRSEAQQSSDSAATLVSLIDSAPEPALACDRGGFITFANTAAGAFLDQEAGALVGRPLVSCAPSRSELTRLLDGLLKHDVVDIETEVPGSQGRSWVAISSRRLRGPDGEVRGNVLFIRDSSDPHRARAELAAKNAEFDDYVSHVSHDLRSPLVSVLGFTGLLRRDYESTLDADGMRFLDRIEQAGQTMQSLIDSLLEFSRVGQVDDAASAADSSGVLQQVLTEQKKRIDEQGVAVHVPDDPPMLDCGRTHAYQILSNLVSNAIAHASSVAHPEIWIEIDGQPHCHHILVRDNGPGVAEADRERIFELFTTASPAGKSLGSTGVGLAIVRKLATQYGGNAWVEDSTDGGAEFHVTISRS